MGRALIRALLDVSLENRMDEVPNVLALCFV